MTSAKEPESKLETVAPPAMPAELASETTPLLAAAAEAAPITRAAGPGAEPKTQETGLNIRSCQESNLMSASIRPRTIQASGHVHTVKKRKKIEPIQHPDKTCSRHATAFNTISSQLSFHYSRSRAGTTPLACSCVAAPTTRMPKFKHRRVAFRVA